MEGNKDESIGNNTKKVFEDLENQGRKFEEESEEFAGDDIVLTFSIKGGNETIDGKSFQEKFKGGQDWEFVKYKVGQMLDVDGDSITLLKNDAPIIPIYSICDIELNESDVITIQIN